MDLTFFELFAGAGGMSMGLEMAGWRCIGHAEIEPHARAVLRHHWPDTPLHGDVAQIDGTALRGVTMITGGSPCQDLSIAGKRAGMVKDSGTRSSLFFEQIRIWEESEAPFILWENVYGAFSSQQGRDFAAVLSAIVGAAVPVPADGWRGAGVASGPAGIAAWRTLDAQYFGVPQRRRRVFVLGTRAAGVDPAEILSLAESLSGDTTPSGEPRQNIARDSSGGIKGACFPIQNPTLNKAQNGLGIGNADDPMYSLESIGHGVVQSTILRNREGKLGGGKGPLLSAEKSLTLGTTNDQVLFTETFRMVAFGEYATDGTASAIKAMDYKDATDLAVGGLGIPRRLTPIECERLMGWPDAHTAYGINESGKAYELADTARYKLCGNGIASPVVAWIGFQLKEAV